MDNLDNFLNSVGLPSTESTVEETSDTTPIMEADTQRIANEVPMTPEECSPHSLSQNDFDDILQGLGFVESTIEPVSTTNESEEYEDIGEGRDLDAEEDEDWNAVIESSSITPVEMHNEAQTMANTNEDTEDTSTENSENEPPLIQPNSPTLLMDASTSRFSGAEWFDEIQKQRIIIAGIGGIGSNLAFQIARMCPASMLLYDDDLVETVNMSGQLFSASDIGKSKVGAITDMITNYTAMRNIYAIKDKFGDNSEAGDIMICGFDNMSARRTFFDAWLKHVENKPIEEQSKCLFLDGRLSIDCLQVLCITGDDRFNINRYRSEFLFTDAEADATICSMKQTTYLACMIGSLMTNLFTNFVADQLDPIIPYDLPFFTEYDAQNMIFKTEK
jgi:hypothetical protein